MSRILASLSVILVLVACSSLAQPGSGRTGVMPAAGRPDCPECPEMVGIAAGDFMMGSPPSEKFHQDNEGPQHWVHVGAFQVSRTPITRGQWRMYADGTGHRSSEGCHWQKPEWDWLNPGFPQDDMHPAVCVSWQEVQDYIAWLNKKSGQHFRLLTEAEYEYMNRAGTQTAYFWGNSDGDLALYANNNGRGTMPVGSFKPNPWGLFDTTGNVWEWTQDCAHRSYNGAPADGGAWEAGGHCDIRVVRGGSWINYTVADRFAGLYRSAFRTGFDNGNHDIGARLARTP